MSDTLPLAKIAQQMRRDSLISTTEAGSGHPSTCLSCAEIMSVLFFDEMHFDPKDPRAYDVDVFVLSKGHAAPILWSALFHAGGIQEDLRNLRKFTSPLEGHPTPRNPWVRVATGSRVVSTMNTPCRSVAMPVTSVFFHSVAPCSAAEAMKPFMTL